MFNEDLIIDRKIRLKEPEIRDGPAIEAKKVCLSCPWDRKTHLKAGLQATAADFILLGPFLSRLN